jgi:hypothetical protein
MAEITLEPGVLPPPACYADEQARFNAYVAAIIATVDGGLQWEASETAPTDEDLFWLRLDGSGRPVEALQWSVPDGAWVRYQSEVINTGTPGGAGNNYTLTNSPAMTAATAYRIGTTFTFKSTLANTDTATLNVDGLGARTIKKFGGTSDLAGGDIVVGQMVTVVYDGTNFQVISALTSTIANGVQTYTVAGSGNWTVPAGVYSVVVECVGGGGGGGFRASGCAGGGGGGYSRKRWTVAPGTLIPYVVGVGGTRGTDYSTPNSTAGGDTSFNTTQIATGGVRGDSGGAGGSFAGSDYGFNGEGGYTETVVDSPGKWKGGKPGFGGGYGGVWDGTTAHDGYAGGGGCGDNDATGTDSSNGGAGLILITW